MGIKEDDWEWSPGQWPDLVAEGKLEDLGEVALNKIGVPWGWNIQCHPNYDRLFWSIYNDGLRTPLLVRPWDWPPYAGRGKTGCKADGGRLDTMPAPDYGFEPEYELVIGNMRYCAIYIQGYETAPTLMLPEEEWYLDVEELWAKYHPVFEGNWYDNPLYGMPSKADNNYLVK